MLLDGIPNTSAQNCVQENGTYTCRGSIPFPNAWNDAKRLQVLFAPFRKRDVNPENYDSKMKFWQNMIESFCAHNDTAVFSKATLQIAFAKDNKTPYCLDAVIAELYHKKKIRLYAEYEYDPLNGWTSWIINALVWRPFTWGVNKFKSSIGKYNETNTEYIHLASLKQFCEKLQTEVMPLQIGKIMHFTTFKQLLNAMHVHLKDKTLYLCLITLNCQKKVALELKLKNNERNIHLIKIPAPNDPNSHEITETDKAKHQLQMTQSNLQQQLENLETEILKFDKKVRQSVNDNKRTQAKTYLRKKHLLEKNHEKRAQALQKIEQLLDGIQEASSNGEILDAYKIGANALQQVLNATDLDKVDEIVADVRESLDANRQIENSWVNAATAGAEYELDHVLELELRDMIKEERVLQAPNVPQYIPDTTRNSGGPLTVTNRDDELLAMLDELELEHSTPPRQNATTTNSHNSGVFN